MVIKGTHLDEGGHPWSSMALTRADGTPSALVLDFEPALAMPCPVSSNVLDFELALELALAMPCPVSSNVPDANVSDFELDFELALELSRVLELDGRSAT